VGPVLAAVQTGFAYRVNEVAAFGINLHFALAKYMGVKRQVRGAEYAPVHSYSEPQDEIVSSKPMRRIKSPLHEWIFVNAHVAFWR
jgi:hypothetical protein